MDRRPMKYARWIIPFLLFSFIPQGVDFKIFGRSPMLSYFDMAMVVTIAVLMLRALLGRFSFQPGDKTLSVLVWIYLLANMLSFVFSMRDPLRSWLEIKIIVFGYFVYLITISTNSAKNDIWRLSTALVAFGATMALLLLWSFGRTWSGDLSQESALVVKSEIGVSGARSNYLASFLLPIVPVAFSRVFSAQGTKRVVLVATFGLLLAGLLVTMSRGAIIALAAAIVMTIPLVGRSLIRVKTVLWVGAGLVALYFVIPSTLINANYAAFTGLLATGDANRIALWKVAWQQFLANPILGVGPGCIYIFNFQFALEDIYSHNYLLNSLADVGLLGTVPFIAILCVVVKRVYTVARSCTVNNEVKSLSVALFMGLIATLIHGFVEPTFVAQEYAAVFWVVAGLVRCLQQQVVGESEEMLATAVSL